jgi:hypothetical protein
LPESPKIPMHPSHLPQQRLRLVHDMPIASAEYELRLGAAKGIAKRLPRSAEYVCQLEWAWSPMHNRIEAFYVSKSRKHWVLWSSYFDDNYSRWEKDVAAVCGLKADQKDATMLMLFKHLDDLRRSYEIEHYHWISESGFLSVGEIDAVAREVWNE